MSTKTALPDGLYDLLITDALASRLDAVHDSVLSLKSGAAEVLADSIFQSRYEPEASLK